MSMMAKVAASSQSLKLGASPLTILQKMQPASCGSSAMVSSRIFPEFRPAGEAALFAFGHRPGLAERGVLVQRLDQPRHMGAFLLEIAADGIVEAPVGHPVHGMDRHGKIAAGQLVLTLGTSLDPFQPVPDRVFDCLVVAAFEMQEGMILNAAPVAAIEGIFAPQLPATAHQGPAR